LDVAHFAATLQAWGDEGAFAVDNYVYGVGKQTAVALLRLRNGVPAHEAGGSDEKSNGNGALMRVLPLVLWHDGPDELLVADAIAQARPTHGHPWSHVCVAWYCLVARQLLAGVSPLEAWPEAAFRLPSLLREPALEDAYLRVANAMHDPPEGTGFVIDTLRSARWACDAPDFANVVRRAISLGHDADTTACVAGGLAGITFGLTGIPDNWLAGLRGRHIVDPLASVLLQHRCLV
jgi:ADP-ribosylglycohydrolase